MSRVVWVLGSGFSKPLGGPTLDDLFTMRAFYELDSIYDSQGPFQDLRSVVFSSEAGLARRLYLVGCSRKDEPQMGNDARFHERFGRRWGDAEEFLDVIETAAQNTNGALAKMLMPLVSTIDNNAPTATDRVIAIRNAARRTLALECLRFLLHTSPLSERWEPYRTWRDILLRKELEHEHTIITFNYDTVLEMLDLRSWVTCPSNAESEGPCILKLHGSVDWKRLSNGCFQVVHDDPHFAARCKPDELSIAPPGPDKIAIAEQFEPLWKLAETRLRAADKVFFIGYRFPPTDSTARRRILGAVNPKAALHVVLGPDERSPDIARLLGMLGFQCPGRTPTVHPMWAQDLLSVFPTGLLAT